MLLTLQVKSGISLSVTDNWCILYHFCPLTVHLSTARAKQMFSYLKWARHIVHEFRNIQSCIRQRHCSNASLWCSTLLLLQWTDRYTCLLCSNVWPILTFTQTSCAETHFSSNQLFILKTKWSSQWRFKKKPPVDIVFCLTPNGIKYIINTFSESRIPRKYSGPGENKF